jgi:hypothetical protein
MSIESDYKSLQRLHDSTNQAVIDLQRKNMELMEENKLLIQKLQHCQEALDINKEIMRNALTEQNHIKDTYSEEISILRGKIKLLEG